MTVEAPAKADQSLDPKAVSGQTKAHTGGKSGPSLKIFSSLFAWLLLLAVLIDVGAGLFIAKNTSDAHQSKLAAFFNSDMRADLIVLGSSVAMASSYAADKEMGYTSNKVDKSDYLGLTDLPNMIFERTGKRLSGANVTCFGSMTSDTWMIACKAVEFKKKPRVLIYQTISRDLFDASLAPIEESPYIRYISSIHPKTEGNFLPKPVARFIDTVQNSKLYTAVTMMFEDDQTFKNPQRFQKQADLVFCALSNIYANRIAISSKLIQTAAELLHRNTSIYASSLAAKIENKKKNPFAKLSDAAPGSFEVNEVPQLRRYEQERAYFSKLLKLCKENDIKLVVVNMPTQVAYKNLMPYGLRKICPMETYTQARQSGFEVIDLDNPAIFTPAHFVDLLHLNAKGALKVNRVLADELSRRHVLDSL